MTEHDITPEEELTELRDEVMGEIGADTKRKLAAYWTKRAELVSRSRTNTLSFAAEKTADGQISICYETADMIRSALKREEEKANSKTQSRIPAGGLSAV